MKKLLIGTVCLLVATVMFGCEKEKETVIYNGVVGEVREGEFDFEFDNNGALDNMIVITDEKDLVEGEFVSVEAEPIVMLSEPARVNALKIEKVETYNMPNKKLYCHLLEFDEDNYLIVGANEVTEGDMVLTYKVDCSEVGMIPKVSAGTKLVIEYDGTMTKSIQPTLVAKSIEVDFPER